MFFPLAPSCAGWGGRREQALGIWGHTLRWWQEGSVANRSAWTAGTPILLTSLAPVPTGAWYIVGVNEVLVQLGWTTGLAGLTKAPLSLR